MTAKIKKPAKPRGTRPQRKSVDPKVRAAKRLLQAERSFNVPWTDADAQSARYLALVARIEKLKAGSWPTANYGGAE